MNLIPKEERYINVSDGDTLDRYEWDMRLAWRPHVSVLSRDVIDMFTYAYRGTRKIYGPAGEPPIYKHKWLNSVDYLFLKIKGTL